LKASLFTKISEKKSPIGIIGLGYVGLPLAALLAQNFRVIGFDINEQRVKELSKGFDRTDEVSDRKALVHDSISYTVNPEELKHCSVIIVTVPTPVDEFKKPNLRPLLSASETVGRYMSPGTLVVYESTVYPGCTENECRNVIEKHSKLEWGKDFDLGYSPERVNPGDKQHTIDKITKIISASSSEALDLLSQIYGSVIQGGIHKAPNIKTAEAAKVIENIQRDINIALINELALIFDRCDIDTQEVLEAAGTKWNFLRFTPGLVGGHCIGVDPYYLTYMAEGLGLNSQLVLSGRRINDSMGPFVAEKAIKLVLNGNTLLNHPLKFIVAGLTFKENVPDLRNSKVIDVIQSLEDFGATVYCVDPVCDPKEFEELYGRKVTAWEDLPVCDGVIIAVKHKTFSENLSLYEIERKLDAKHKVLLDLKGLYDRHLAKSLGINLWRL
jgi:UDP-N-acetyl-D-galactosamine dehydrogenase